MTIHALLNTFNVTRQMTIGRIMGIPEELFDVQPHPFNNTVRWNVGHLVASFNSMVVLRADLPSELPQAFIDLFKSGTKPADWTTAPPSKEELVQRLQEQLKAVNEQLAERMDEPLATPMQMRDFTLESIGSLVGFAAFHEGMHLANIGDLVKVINSAN